MCLTLFWVVANHGNGPSLIILSVMLVLAEVFILQQLSPAWCHQDVLDRPMTKDDGPCSPKYMGRTKLGKAALQSGLFQLVSGKMNGLLLHLRVGCINIFNMHTANLR